MRRILLLRLNLEYFSFGSFYCAVVNAPAILPPVIPKPFILSSPVTLHLVVLTATAETTVLTALNSASSPSIVLLSQKPTGE